MDWLISLAYGRGQRELRASEGVPVHRTLKSQRARNFSILAFVHRAAAPRNAEAFGEAILINEL